MKQVIFTLTLAMRVSFFCEQAATDSTSIRWVSIGKGKKIDENNKQAMDTKTAYHCST